MTAPLAAIGVDLDTVATHLQGYGKNSPSEGDDAVYSIALPRLLTMLEDLGLFATFFTVGRDAEAHRAEIREIAASGHDIASHSMTHHLPFSTLSDLALEVETRRSRELLQDVSGQAVVGFRAPGWDIGPRVLDAVAHAGYEFDSSVFPSPAIVALRLLTSGRRRVAFGLGSHLAVPRGVHRKWIRGRWIAEVPVAVLPYVPVPFYQTATYYLGERGMDCVAALHRAGGRPLHYTFHALDFLGISDRGVDQRMRRHPGMALPLERKIGLARRRLAWVSRHYECVTLARLAQHVPSPGRGHASVPRGLEPR